MTQIETYLRANRIIILGYSFANPDHFFCEYLRGNHSAQIVIIDKNIEAVSGNVCCILHLAPRQYSRQILNGIEERHYANRVAIVGADLTAVELAKYLKRIK